MSSKLIPETSKFSHIYYDKWQIDATYERKVNCEVIILGRLVSKSLCGRAYDKDILLNFERDDGTTYQHVMEFDSSYRRVFITSV